MFVKWTGSLMIVAVAALVLSATGCSDKEKKDGQQAKGKASPNEDKGGKKELKGDDHSGWWCAEHGVPEEICSLCSDTVAAKLKKEGDWCKDHDRAKSQCFKCDPGLYKKFEDMYVAKYNKKPERPPEEEFKK